MKKNLNHMLENEKQITPMKNEVDPKNAFTKISIAAERAIKKCKLNSQKILSK